MNETGQYIICILFVVAIHWQHKIDDDGECQQKDNKDEIIIFSSKSTNDKPKEPHRCGVNNSK